MLAIKKDVTYFEVLQVLQRLLCQVLIVVLLDALLNPRVSKGSYGSQTRVDVLLHELFDQVLDLVADVVPDLATELPHSLLDLVNDGVFCCTIEGWTSADHDVKHHTDAPHVTLFVVFAGEYLRRDVVWRAEHLRHRVRPIVVVMGRAEVNHLDRTSVLDVNEDILRLKVTMSDVLTVAVCNGLEDLLGHVSCLILAKMVSPTDLVEQLAAVTQLRHEVDGALVLIDFIETHNVGMCQVLEDVDLILQSDLLTLVKLKLVNHFDSSDFSVCLFSGLSDLAEGT